VADCDGESRLIRQLLQFPLPQAHPRAVAPATIGADEQAFGLRILLSPHLVPEASNALHGKGSGIVIDADVHPTSIASQVVYPIRRRAPQALDGEIVDAHVL